MLSYTHNVGRNNNDDFDHQSTSAKVGNVGRDLAFRSIRHAIDDWRPDFSVICLTGQLELLEAFA
jgi:hypothetical protein